MTFDVRLPGLGPDSVPPRREPPMQQTHYYRNYAFSGAWDVRPVMPGSGRPIEKRSRCDLVIFEAPGELPLVLAAEPDDHPGMSVTNAVESLASQVWRELRPRARDGIRFVEYYPIRDRMYRRRKQQQPDWSVPREHDETFDLVTFEVGGTWRDLPSYVGGPSYTLRRPRWQRISRAHVVAWIGDETLLPAGLGVRTDDDDDDDDDDTERSDERQTSDE